LSNELIFLEFVYTKFFERTAKGLLTEDDLRRIELNLILNPWLGDTERGTGGVRKARFPLGGRGKSGGARVVYFFDGNRSTIYLLLAWPKGAKTSLTDAERNTLKQLVKTLKQ